MSEHDDLNQAAIGKIKELLAIYREIFSHIAELEHKLEEEIDVVRRMLDNDSVENLKHHLNHLNNTQTRLVNQIRDLNVAYTKLRNAVK